MNSINDDERRDLDTANDIFTNSPTLLALCLTVIGLVKIYAKLQGITTLIDDCLALALLAFLFATILSYLAIRAGTRPRRLRFARLADFTFLAGLGGVGIAAAFVVFTLAG